MSWNNVTWIHHIFNVLGFINFYVHFPPQIWKFSSIMCIYCLLVSHKFLRLSSFFFILFSFCYFYWIILNDIFKASCWISLLNFSAYLLYSSAPEFLLGSFLWFLSLCWQFHFVYVLFSWFYKLCVFSYNSPSIFSFERIIFSQLFSFFVVLCWHLHI